MEILKEFYTGPKTAKEVGVQVSQLYPLVVDGLLIEKDPRETGLRGRPAFVFALSDKGRKRVKRVLANKAA